MSVARSIFDKLYHVVEVDLQHGRLKEEFDDPNLLASALSTLPKLRHVRLRGFSPEEAAIVIRRLSQVRVSISDQECFW